MKMSTPPVVAIILGDPAGSSYELCVMTALQNQGDYIPVFVGNRRRFDISRQAVKDQELLQVYPFEGRPQTAEKNVAYFVDVEGGEDVQFGKVTPDSGKITYESMIKALDLCQEGLADGVIMAPITKNAFHAAGYEEDSEFAVFAKFYNLPAVKSVVTANSIYRASVTGHCAFRDIVPSLTTEGIVSTGRRLMGMMEQFLPPEKRKMAVAALNPHASDNGAYGDEEARIIEPAVRILQEDGMDVIGPVPADTVFDRAIKGQINGIVFLYHDQGNIAMKARYFDEGVVIYTGTPHLIVSPGHGPAYGKAGKGTANPSNMLSCAKTLLELLSQKSE